MQEEVAISSDTARQLLEQQKRQPRESTSAGLPLSATILEDYTSLPNGPAVPDPSSGLKDPQNPTIAIEIKPKCGFLPTNHVEGQRRSISKFQLQQHLKLAQV